MGRTGGPTWASLFLTVLSIILGQAAAVVYNTSSPEECSVPLLPPEPKIPACGPNATATLEEAIARAWEFAPVVHTHILEPWHLQDPVVFWNNSELYLTDGLPPANSSYDFMLDNPQEFMMLSPKSYITVLNNTALTQKELDAVMAGAPFDANNHSTAKVTFTVVEDPPNFFTYNFNLFYSWNGCSNQAITLTLDGKRNVTNYIMCPPSVHEGDWERVSVLVCKSDWSIKRMAFSQHAWAQEVDCTVPGNCLVDPETGHFSTFAGLYSHANYPHPSPLWVYAFVNGTISANVSLNNLNGLYIADRHITDPWRKWVPRPELLTYIPPLGQQDNSTEFRWSRYAGNWGAPLALPEISLTCLNEDQTEVYPCPDDDQATSIILQVTKLAKNLPLPVIGQLGGSDEGYTAETVNNATRIGYPGIPGPMTRAYSYKWYPTPVPPIQSSNLTTVICPNDVPIGKDIPTVTKTEFTASATTLTNYIVGVAVGDILFSLLLVLVMSLPALMDRSARVQRLVVQKMGAAGRAARHAASGLGHGAAAVDAAIPGQHARAEVFGAVGAGVGAVERGAAAILVPLKPGTAHTTTTAAPLTDADADVEVPSAAVPAVPAIAEDPSASATKRRPLPSFADDEDPSVSKSMSMTGSYMTLEAESLHVGADSSRHTKRWILWFVIGAGLFISGFVLSIFGLVRLFTDSVIALALDTLGASSVGQTVYGLLIALICIIAAFDLFVLYVLYFMIPDHLDFGRWKPRNLLGGWGWAQRKSWEIYLCSVGLMVLVVNICALLFALGFVITIAQILTQIACHKAMDVSILGESALSVCINVPFFKSGGEVCGWEVYEVCANVTSLDTRYLMFGAMLLTWCHLIWLISMVVLLEEQRQRKVYIKRAKSMDMGASGVPEASQLSLGD